MDKFLNNFRNKVNKAREPDFNPSDWEKFKAFKKATLAKHEPVSINYWFSLRSSIIVAASLLLISLYAYSILNTQFIQEEKVQSVIEIQNRDKEKDLISEKEIDNTIKEKEIQSELEEYQEEKIKIDNASIQQEKKTDKSIPLVRALQEIQSPTFESKTENKEIPVSNATAEEKRSIEKSYAYNYSDQTETYELPSDKIHEFAASVQTKEKKNDENIQSASMKPVSVIASRSMFIQHNYEMMLLPAQNYLPFKNSYLPDFKRVQISGSGVFTKAISDRIGASVIYGGRFACSYYFSERLRIGISFAQARYSRTLNSKEKEKYPALDAIKPREVGEKIEDLTINASIINTGFDINYDFLSLGRLKSSFGLGIQKDISNDFAVRMRVRDQQGKQNFQNQKHKIVRQNRYYLSPNYYIEYSVWKNLSLFGRVQYDISLSEYREKYLNIGIGTAISI